MHLKEMIEHSPTRLKNKVQKGVRQQLKTLRMSVCGRIRKSGDHDMNPPPFLLKSLCVHI